MEENNALIGKLASKVAGNSSFAQFEIGLDSPGIDTQIKTAQFSALVAGNRAGQKGAGM